MPALIFLLATLLNLDPSSKCHAASVLDRVEASVNSEIILLSDIRSFRKLMRLRSQLDPIFAESELSKKSNPPDGDIRDYLIQEKIILINFPTSDEEVEQEVRSIETKNKITRSTLENALRQQGVSFKDYTSLIRISTATKKLIDRDIRTKVFISDEDVRAHYNTSSPVAAKSMSYEIRIITTNDADDAKLAAQAISEGVAFEEVAKKYSNNPTASSGGDLGVLHETEMSAAVRQEVKKLKVGQTSGVVKGSSPAFMILKLVSIKAGKDSEFDQRKEEQRAKLAISEYRRQIQLWLERKLHEAFVHIPKNE